MKQRNAQPQVEITIDRAFALSARAFRELNGYFKDSDRTAQPMGQTNKSLLMEMLLESQDGTAEDYQRGQQLRQFCQGLLVKKLTQTCSEYDSHLLDIASRETITDADRYHVALLASVPATVARAEAREQQDRSLLDRQTSYLAPVGGRVDSAMTVVRGTFSSNHGVYFITAKTRDNHVVFFAYKTQLKSGETYRIRGTVKAHRNDYQTQLNRVRVMA